MHFKEDNPIKKRILITSTDLMMLQFLMPHVRALREMGAEVELACSDVGGRLGELQREYPGTVHPVKLVRSPLSLSNLRGYRDLRALLRRKPYDIIWTNEPVMGAMTRLAARSARKAGTKVAYLCHGFHFYRGAPMKNWLLFYPAERFLARFCDRIITINREDFARAQAFRGPEVKYVPGVGVDPHRLEPAHPSRDLRQELGLRAEDFFMLSVGELNRNKNHALILRAMALLKDPRIHCCFCGRGGELDKLKLLAEELGIDRQVYFPGYRRDLGDFYRQADILIHPSKREGLGMAPLEAMYCGLPLIAGNIRGIRDYARHGHTGLLCDLTPQALAEAIRQAKENPNLREQWGYNSRKTAESFLLESAQPRLIQALTGFEADSTAG